MNIPDLKAALKRSAGDMPLSHPARPLIGEAVDALTRLSALTANAIDAARLAEFHADADPSDPGEWMTDRTQRCIAIAKELGLTV